MRKQELNYALTIKLSEGQRKAIERLAEARETTLGAAARLVMAIGLKAL
jgi:hypothetical protein